MKKKTLSEKQKRVLEHIEIYIGFNGYAPTLSEISTFFGFNIPTAQYYVDVLVDKGYLGKYRGTINLVEGE